MTIGSLHGTVNVIARGHESVPPALNRDTSARRQSGDRGGSSGGMQILGEHSWREAVPPSKFQHISAVPTTSCDRESSVNMAEIGGLNRKRRDDPIMVSADENRPIAGSGSSKAGRTGKKADKRRRKAAQKSAPKPAAPIETSEAPLQASAAPAEAPEVLAEAPDTRLEVLEVPQAALDALPEAPEQALAQPDLPVAPTESAPAAASDTPSIAPARPVESARPVSVQTIANAYGCYAAKSLEQTGSFFEQLAGVRSLNRAFELQTEFAKQAYETFVTESQKIRQLHSELAKQRLSSLEGLVTGKKVTRSS
jgi:hypothetical protein